MPQNTWKPPLSPKQMQLVARCHPRPGKPKYGLVSGCRYSTKTYGCLHALVNHAWNVKSANVSVISPTVTSADDSGCWEELTTNVIPKWVDGNFGLEWVTPPRQKGTTKKLYCQITNKFGGVSRFQLDSLQHEAEVEGRFKNKSHSAIYMSEASYYKHRKTFDIIIECLRGEKWSDDDFLFLLDTNPADEGTESWLWKLFYDFRVQADLSDNDRVFQKNIWLMEFTIEDNIFMSKERLSEQLARYAHSEDLMARYARGEWVRAVGNSVFFEQFRPKIHIVGEFFSRDNPEPETLLPESNCSELLTGWDIGSGPNSAFHIAEKVYQQRNNKDVSIFKFLDEVVYIGSENSMTDFVRECMDKIQFWENIIGRPVNWRNWSDRSAFDNRERIANIFHHQLVFNETDGKIRLQAADRSPGSMIQRVNITKKVLFENRMYISRSRCPNLIDSIQSIRPGKGNSPLDKTSKFKHALDSATYLLASECYDELYRPRQDLNVGKTSAGMISIPM
jgi:hypothetical protein